MRTLKLYKRLIIPTVMALLLIIAMIITGDYLITGLIESNVEKILRGFGIMTLSCFLITLIEKIDDKWEEKTE